MAIPPEPLDEVLPDATSAVLAEVARVVQQDPPREQPATDPAASDVGIQSARQVVELKVREVLFGKDAKPGDAVQAEKPVGAYALRPGNKGPFVLQAQAGKPARILGRYGPDTWREEVVRAGAAKRK